MSADPLSRSATQAIATKSRIYKFKQPPTMSTRSHPFMRPSILIALVTLLAAAPRVSAAVNPAFDAWADRFSADWARQSPQFTTSSQFFSGAEQDALDRQLSMIGQWTNPYGQTAINQRAALARRG